jgi:hypothetical protein
VTLVIGKEGYWHAVSECKFNFFFDRTCFCKWYRKYYIFLCVVMKNEDVGTVYGRKNIRPQVYSVFIFMSREAFSKLEERSWHTAAALPSCHPAVNPAVIL